ncbi:hypothetical protein [Paenibacillus senegalensis]|uniref:hypothetical protein n=1 Tax=Paenibacillus senegalensis TaxID=1465766 RepID=UPI000287CEB6|nr:hypothetical protein [Paenibacillus senegalensis]
MSKTVTFSFSSAVYEDIQATETFTFEKLGIEEKLDEKALKIEIDKIFQAWVWDKLSISFSIVMEESDIGNK